jgi:hypothetical protein
MKKQIKKMNKGILSKKEKREIFWNIVNSILSGILVLFGSFIGNNFNFSKEGILASIIISVMVAITKFKDYWDGEKTEYQKRVFHFLG